jgi:hypothetical protein
MYQTYLTLSHFSFYSSSQKPIGPAADIVRTLLPPLPCWFATFLFSRYSRKHSPDSTKLCIDPDIYPASFRNTGHRDSVPDSLSLSLMPIKES